MRREMRGIRERTREKETCFTLGFRQKSILPLLIFDFPTPCEPTREEREEKGMNGSAAGREI